MTDRAADLDLAARAVRAGAAAALAERDTARRGGDGLGVEVKDSPTDFVSRADTASEAAIVALLRAERPDDGVLGEEGAAAEGESGRRWVVDGIDGTFNFLSGIAHWCVAVGLEDGGVPVAGAVYDPSADELFLGGDGVAASVNGAPAAVRTGRTLAEASVATYLRPDKSDDRGHDPEPPRRRHRRRPRRRGGLARARVDRGRARRRVGAAERLAVGLDPGRRARARRGRRGRDPRRRPGLAPRRRAGPRRGVGAGGPAAVGPPRRRAFGGEGNIAPMAGEMFLSIRGDAGLDREPDPHLVRRAVRRRDAPRRAASGAPLQRRAGYSAATASPAARAATTSASSTARNAATTRGSNWLPAQRSSSAIASASGIAAR